MNWILQVIKSTIGRKLIAGITGLGLVGFVIGHMVGNLNVFKSSGAMHEYAEALHHLAVLEHYKILWVIELGLLGMFVAHIAAVVSLILDNRRARGAGKYAVSASKRDERVSSLASRTMAVSGLVLLAFLVIHIVHFRLKRAMIETQACGIGGEVVDLLSNPLWAAFYALGSVLVAWHIFHGIQSSAMSLGVNHRKYTPAITTVGTVIALVVGVGFTSIPIAIAARLVDNGGIRVGRDTMNCEEYMQQAGDQTGHDDHAEEGSAGH